MGRPGRDPGTHTPTHTHRQRQRHTHTHTETRKLEKEARNIPHGFLLKNKPFGALFRSSWEGPQQRHPQSRDRAGKITTNTVHRAHARRTCHERAGHSAQTRNKFYVNKATARRRDEFATSVRAIARRRERNFMLKKQLRAGKTSC